MLSVTKNNLNSEEDSYKITLDLESDFTYRLLLR